MTSNDESADGTDNSDNDDEATKTFKRRERLEQNRISARESRKRKKNMIEELQRTVITLSRENKELNERNETLRRDLVEIGTNNPGVVRIVFIFFAVLSDAFLLSPRLRRTSSVFGCDYTLCANPPHCIRR
jgi:hypothetical protein